MAITDLIRTWFRREHGYSLEDAFDVMEANRQHKGQCKAKGTPSLITRGYPFEESTIDIAEVDAENERIINEVANSRKGTLNE